MERKIGVALVGCGRIAPLHASALKELPFTELIMTMDVIRERAEKMAQEYGGEPTDSFQDVLTNPKVEVVEICTPHYNHARLVLAALEAGKHVLVEKPMAINVEDAKAMIATAKRKGRQLGVIFQNRYNDASQAVKEVIEKGELGRILATRAFLTWHRSDEYYNSDPWRGSWAQEGGGVLINQAIHTLDLMQWLMGEIKAISANCRRWGHSRIEVEDTAEAYFRFANGALGCFYATNCYPTHEPIFFEVTGERGKAQIIADRATITIDGKSREVKPQADSVSHPAYWGRGHQTQLAHYYQSLLKGEDVEIDGKSGMVAMAMVLAMYASSATGAEIDFQQFIKGSH
jgi:UDP-N-acetyl-2-amino-2-deoxyglucuronate dehydrogenase